MKIMNINVMGPQGAGKGTQASLLAKRLGLVHLITSAVVMKNLHLLPSKEHAEFKRIFDEGSLWPGDLVAKVLYKKIEEVWKKNLGIVLDGFPRNFDQVKSFEKLLKEGGFNWDLFRFVYIDIGRSESIRRIMGRRVCSRCKHSVPDFQEYKFDMYCRKCGGKLVHRKDDLDRKAVELRLDVFFKETQPVRSYFKEKGLLIEVDGEQPIEKVYLDVVDQLGL
jgi:adenylate kinase